MADSGARLARRVADQERLTALTLQAQELADSFAAEDALADQEEAASLADFDQALAESLGQADCKCLVARSPHWRPRALREDS